MYDEKEESACMMRRERMYDEKEESACMMRRKRAHV